MPRCPLPMTLRALRAARWTRTLLLLAAFAATAGSFGLHPEPESGPPVPTAGTSWTASLADDGGADACTACLAHRTISLTGLSVVSPTGSPLLEAPPVPAARRLRLFHPRLDDGRAPPTLL
ncbi:MAG: hypothetical protein ABI592_10465 [Acidobacteriota bacterium]